MERICGTRILKNAKAIRSVAPHIIPFSEPIEGFRSLVPLDILKSFHCMSEADLANFPELQIAKRKLAPPSVKPELFGDPPFKGTIHVVRLTFFTEANHGSILITHTDVQTAIQYATLAVQPISAYASAYSHNELKVSPDALEFGIAVTSTRYNDDFVQGIVNKVLQDNHTHLGVGSPCIVLLNPPGMTNTDADLADGILGYHDKADAPYCFVNLLGTGLTVQDMEDLYADTLSHEIAEMTCDPDDSVWNHEVCDGCAGNCNNSWRNFFNPNPSPANAYIGSSKAFPPAFPFTYFTASIAKPDGADDCPTRDDWCAYAPPAHTATSELLWHNNSDGTTQIWAMDGAKITGRSNVVDENGNPISIGPPWQIVGAGDTDGNGKADIVWHNSTDNSTQIWFMDGAKITDRSDVVDENGDPILVGPPWQIVGVGDLYGNGRADIVWYNTADGTTQVWYMNGAKITGRANAVDENGNDIFIGPPWQIVGVGDMDGNGKADIVWHSTADGTTQIWFMNRTRISSRANVVGENGDPILVGPPWQIVGTGTA
jgi:hypothetical protein